MPKTEVAKKTKQSQFRDLVEAMKPKMAGLLPKHLTPERIAKVLIVEASRTPEIMECSTRSVAESIMLSAQLGLEPGGTLGHIYFIPFKDKRRRETTCTPIIGYKGYLELARRSGQVARLDARVVYEGEPFKVSAGLKPDIQHTIRGDVDRSDNKLIAAYAVAILKDGSEYFEVMWRSEIDTTKSRSKGAHSDRSPWSTDYARMARKTAIRALFNGGCVPMSFEIATAVDLDGDNPHAPDLGDVIDVDFVNTEDEEEPKQEVNGGMDGLKDALSEPVAEA
jgi:recombination protein RecT